MNPSLQHESNGENGGMEEDTKYKIMFRLIFGMEAVAVADSWIDWRLHRG